MTSPPTCTRCGQPVGPADRFCPRCGSDVSGVQASIATAVVQAPAQPPQARPRAPQLEPGRKPRRGESETLGGLGRAARPTVFLPHATALDPRVAIKGLPPP